MTEGIEIAITGGAGPHEAAAIVAAIDAALTEEYLALATPPPRPVPGAWVMSGRPQVVVGPPTTFQGLSAPTGFEEEGDSTEP